MMKELNSKKWFVTDLTFIFAIALAFVAAISLIGCGEDDGVDEIVTGGTSIDAPPLESPFLICAGRNPEGVGFDFISDNPGVAYNMSEAPDLEYDILIRVLKAETPDGEVKGNPYVKLYGDVGGPPDAVMAFDASSLSNVQTGDAGYNALTGVTDDILSGLQKDLAGFDLDGVEKGEFGFPLFAGEGNLSDQLKKLVIGDKWKSTAKNKEGESRPSGDEQVWVIRTREGKFVKFIFCDFPAINAPTPTGYVAAKWEVIN
jgi:hypothetical protein